MILPARYRFPGVFLVCVATLGFLALVSYKYAPSIWPDSHPVSLRLPVWLPGVSRLIAWDAHHHAELDHADGKRLLLGWFESGTDVGLPEDCELLSYRRGIHRPEDLPAWYGAGLVGTMTVRCRRSSGPQRLSFTNVEMGCLVVDATHAWSMQYNRRMLQLARE